jgi:hypothetical protein
VKRVIAILSTAGAFLSQVSAAQSPAALYREPASFRELSATIVDALNKEGCRIPQGTINGEIVATNVISGDFAKRGQTDWAVLCSKQKRQYIRVFWGGPNRCASRISMGSDASDFDRAIATADREYIVDRYDAYGGPKPPNITHLGINYQYLERASVVRYCHRGKWLELTGAD